ncbi:hypothetical protein AKJ08_2750 [Vulgatibacter incomptus]|uniref:Uncharacterized protein n=1 Tax=Vulgatibacter incomptus TaxID=1391653 RepID=A0A0K1PFQ2_9BACT|nr:hypothetical protein AKJ08_2750 [Vulgatibacter incomptus]
MASGFDRRPQLPTRPGGKRAPGPSIAAAPVDRFRYIGCPYVMVVNRSSSGCEKTHLAVVGAGD